MICFGLSGNRDSAQNPNRCCNINTFEHKKSPTIGEAFKLFRGNYPITSFTFFPISAGESTT